MANTIPTDRGARYRFAGVVLTSTRVLSELRAAGDDDGPAAIVVGWRDASAPPRPPVDWFHAWSDGTAEWARFGATDEGWVVAFPALATFRIDRSATRVEVEPVASVPPYTVSHLLLNQVLPLVLSRQGRLVLHAGAVATEEGITAFVGPTGSGKSTLVAACAVEGAEVVCDDSLVVSRGRQHWIGVPSYPAVRLWPSGLEQVGATASDPAAHYTDKRRVGPEHGAWRFAEQARPLRRLILLAGDQPVRPLAVELYAQVFRLDVRDPVEAVRLFHDVADLAADLEVVRLGPRATRDPVSVARRLLRPPQGSGIVGPYG